jgi:hypothetical protein
VSTPAAVLLFDFQVDEIKHNLPLELDFNHEMANAERCRRNLNSAKSSVAKRCGRDWCCGWGPLPLILLLGVASEGPCCCCYCEYPVRVIAAIH